MDLDLCSETSTPSNSLKIKICECLAEEGQKFAEKDAELEVEGEEVRMFFAKKEGRKSKNSKLSGAHREVEKKL